MTITILEKAASALTSNDAKGVQSAAIELIALIRDGHSDLIPPLLVVVDVLAAQDVPAAVAAARDAARHASSGSALERQAVTNWAKHVDALAAQDVPAAIAAARDAARNAPSGSALEQQAVAILETLKLTFPSPKRPPEAEARTKEIASFMQRFGGAGPRAPM